MAGDSTITICATFETRDAADLAVEQLVQQHGFRGRTFSSIPLQTEIRPLRALC